ncbi:MAG: hypothetical protein KAI71_04665, partial [Candidatus Pacebacteria bacterium]|nr:hypothetical protein [Candidatus Paceibacterota bacterium]
EAGQFTKNKEGTEVEKDELEVFSGCVQEFIDEMEKGSVVSNGRIMFIKGEIEKYNISRNYNALEERLKGLKKDGDEDDEINSIIIKIDQYRDLNEKVEQVSEFIIKNDQKAKQSRESEDEQQAVIETEGTEETEESQETETEETTEPTEDPTNLTGDTAKPTGEQGTELAGVPESYRGIIDTLKETNRMVNEKITNLSLEDKALVEKLGLGGDLSPENIEKAKQIMELRNLEKATALDISNAKIASSLYAGTHKETMIILDETLKRIEEQGSSLMDGILDLETKEKQRALLGTQAVVAVDNLVGAVGNTRRQQGETQERENNGPVPERESLNGIDSNIADNINRIGSRYTMNKTHDIVIEYIGVLESEIEESKIEFKRSILDNLKDKKYQIVKENCNESIRKARENANLNEEKTRALVAFYEKVIEFTNDREKDQGFFKGFRNRLFNRKKTKTNSSEETSQTPQTPETPQTPQTPETPETPETPQTPQTPQTPETPETPTDNSDIEKISNQMKKKIKEKLREAKGADIDRFQSISGLKGSVNLEETVRKNSEDKKFFGSTIRDELVDSMSEGEKDEIYKMKTKDLFDLYDEVKSE